MTNRGMVGIAPLGGISNSVTLARPGLYRALRRAVMSATCLLWLVILPAPAAAQPTTTERPFGTLREQAAMQQAWLKARLDTFLPALMRKHGIDLWVVPMREYNEDPVFGAITAPRRSRAR